MDFINAYGDGGLSQKIWDRRKKFVWELPVSAKDKSIEFAVKVGGRNYSVVNVFPKKGIANYEGFENIKIKNHEVIIPSNKDKFQAAIVGSNETYFFHTRSSCFEKHGMEQEEYYDSISN